ncbi:glycosyltransferase family 4 protein [Acinetobacter towneri]|uniref:glycosyltransferase family 4 protein n=1 Tax=Acinetobacter towneri TaxID=202956 RepID=UPI002DBD4C87|nr:glycosyltransferase family 4 protein [Acinetobacter towneri]MEB6564906.1 glycosyltransferase family 4 protein [Acinetobacter towneri]
MISIAVCGKFHVLNYIPYLHEYGILKHLYMSHKKTTSDNLNINGKFIINYPIKEYLTQAHGRLLGDFYFNEAQVFYHRIWENKVIKNFNNTQVLHVLAQGACVNLITKAQNSKNTKILVEVVNTHPLHRLNIMTKEANIWGITPLRTKLLQRELLLLKEVDKSDALLAPTRFVAETYRKYGYNKDIYVLPYAANTKRFNPSLFSNINKSDKNKINIISVGQIGLRKGQLYLLRLLEDFEEYINLTLVGSMDNNVRSSFSKHMHKFTHYNRVPSSDMPEILAQNDIFISASIEEGLAVSICEAMSMGLAVIATRESGAEEIIIDGHNGFLFNAGDYDKLAYLLKSLIGSNNLKNKLSENAISDTKKFINWENYSKELIGIYSKLNLV